MTFHPLESHERISAPTRRRRASARPASRIGSPTKPCRIGFPSSLGSSPSRRALSLPQAGPRYSDSLVFLGVPSKRPRKTSVDRSSAIPVCSFKSISRTDSNRSPPHSIRTGNAACWEKTSTIPPRLATSPRSVTVPTVRYPAFTSSSTHARRSSVAPTSTHRMEFRSQVGSGRLSPKIRSVTMHSCGR